jgi:hypothetical protein
VRRGGLYIRGISALVTFSCSNRFLKSMAMIEQQCGRCVVIDFFSNSISFFQLNGFPVPRGSAAGFPLVIMALLWEGIIPGPRLRGYDDAHDFHNGV